MKKSNAIDYIKVNQLDYYKAKEVSNHFGQFYSELRANLANKINNKSLNISKYLSKIPRNQHIIFLSAIMPTEIKKSHK